MNSGIPWRRATRLLQGIDFYGRAAPQWVAIDNLASMLHMS